MQSLRILRVQLHVWMNQTGSNQVVHPFFFLMTMIYLISMFSFNYIFFSLNFLETLFHSTSSILCPFSTPYLLYNYFKFLRERKSLHKWKHSPMWSCAGWPSPWAAYNNWPIVTTHPSLPLIIGWSTHHLRARLWGHCKKPISWNKFSFSTENLFQPLPSKMVFHMITGKLVHFLVFLKCIST